MSQYITVDQVDERLGSDWADPDQKAFAVQQANDWLTAKGVPDDAEGDNADRIIRAGCILARMAASGTLYASNKGRVKRKSVKAGSVESETEYADGSVPVNGDMEYVKALIGDFLSPLGGSVMMVRRI